MRRLFQFLLLGFMAAPAIFAGNLYGTIREGNRPVQRAAVSLACGKAGAVTPVSTDGEGVYRLFIRATGPCQLIVDSNGRKMSTTVYSYDRPTAYNFDIARDGNNWVLRKR